MEPQATLQPQIPPIPPKPLTPQVKNSLVLIMSVLLIITVGIAGLFYFQIQKLSKELLKYQIQPSPTPTETADPTADWKTYVNKKYLYQFKYPMDWSLIGGPAGYSEEELGKQYFISLTSDTSHATLSLEINKTNLLNILPSGSTCITLDVCVNKFIDPVRKTQEVSEKKIKILDIEAIQVSYKGIDKDSSSAKDLSEIFFIIDKNLYHFIMYNYEENVSTFNQILSTFKFVDDRSSSTTSTPTSKQGSGADLKNIKYKLSPGWEAKLNNDSLFISPVNGGGYLSIRVYDYPGNVGRREYYCQVSRACIEGTSYFTEMNIGNISGYVANALDNSGGGPEYFGTKGSKFYIISSYNPPSPNEFEKNYKNVLSSLVF